MQQFFMNGKAITSIARFCDYFSPTDLLRNREVAAGFLHRYMRWLSLVHQYHVDVFFSVAVGAVRSVNFPNWSSYCALRAGWSEITAHKDQKLVTRLIKESSQVDTLQALWELAMATALEKQDKERLYALLAAVYCLGEKTLQTAPLTVREAELAYLRQDPVEKNAPNGWHRFPAQGEIFLEARETPYRILLGKNAEAALTGGKQIKIRKIQAEQHVQGYDVVPVTLMLYREPEDPVPVQVRLYAGDFCYANFVEDIMVFLHPAQRQTLAGQVWRKGNSLTIALKGRSPVKIDCEKEGILAVIPEKTGEGYLILRGELLDDSGYSQAWLTPLVQENIVQAEFRKEECLLLNNQGQIYSNLVGDWLDARVLSLEDYIGKQGDGIYG